MDHFRFADCSGFANVCATARESQVSIGFTTIGAANQLGAGSVETRVAR